MKQQTDPMLSDAFKNWKILHSMQAARDAADDPAFCHLTSVGITKQKIHGGAINEEMRWVKCLSRK